MFDIAFAQTGPGLRQSEPVDQLFAAGAGVHHFLFLADSAAAEKV